MQGCKHCGARAPTLNEIVRAELPYIAARCPVDGEANAQVVIARFADDTDAELFGRVTGALANGPMVLLKFFAEFGTKLLNVERKDGVLTEEQYKRAAVVLNALEACATAVEAELAVEERREMH